MNELIYQTRTAKIGWIWTQLGEQVSKERGIFDRKAGDPVMERNDQGEYVKRLKVPLTWVEKGYVEEADGEQMTMF